MQNLNISLHNKVVLIGASTGGPGQIEKIVKNIPRLNSTIVVIAQHMARGFISSFASHLQNCSINPVEMAQNNSYLSNGKIYLCSGSTYIKQKNSQLCFIQEEAPENAYNPNINMIFSSFVPFAHSLNILSIILTGIGDDGVNACRELSLNNAKCLTESEKSAIVDGMPHRARAIVPNIEVLDIQRISNYVKEFCE